MSEQFPILAKSLTVFNQNSLDAQNIFVDGLNVRYITFTLSLRGNPHSRTTRKLGEIDSIWLEIKNKIKGKPGIGWIKLVTVKNVTAFFSIFLMVDSDNFQNCINYLESLAEELVNDVRLENLHWMEYEEQFSSEMIKFVIQKKIDNNDKHWFIKLVINPIIKGIPNPEIGGELKHYTQISLSDFSKENSTLLSGFIFITALSTLVNSPNFLRGIFAQNALILIMASIAQAIILNSLLQNGFKPERIKADLLFFLMVIPYFFFLVLFQILDLLKNNITT